MVAEKSLVSASSRIRVARVVSDIPINSLARFIRCGSLQDRSYIVADGFSASVPGRSCDGRLPGHPLLQAVALKRILDFRDEVVGAASNPQYTIEMLVFVKRRNNHWLSGGEVLSNFNGAAVVYECVVGDPGQDADIEARGITGHLFVWPRTEVMDRGQRLYFKGRRSQSDQHPMPVRTAAGNVANQFLIHQPGFHRAEVTETRLRNTANVLRENEIRRGRCLSEVLEVHGLFQ